jgi:pyruvate dehydrogenase E1 component alpha subunit
METKAAAVKVSKETYVDWYHKMLLIRRFEEKAGQMYGMQKIRGFCHLYIGQEAVAAGTVSAARPDDIIITAYRDHGLAIARGMTSKAAMAELYGKATGCVKGKGGSMHYFDKEHSFYGGHAIVGAHIPLAAGLAFAEKYNETDRAVICFFGDGAFRQGAMHEAFNLAAMWSLPVIYVIENNNYAMGTSVKRSGPDTRMFKFGELYGMLSYEVDGMEPAGVHRGLEKALAHVRSGKGPVLIEMKTYRYKGHSMSDPQKYRSKEELETHKALDPIDRLADFMIDSGIITEKQLQEFEAQVKTEVDDAVQFAEESPLPDLEELYRDIYMQPDYPYIHD